MVDPGKFTMGISADRCGTIAAVKVLRPNRKTDLFLCEQHVNTFISTWGLHNQVEILCQDEEEWIEQPILCGECGIYIEENCPHWEVF